VSVRVRVRIGTLERMMMRMMRVCKLLRARLSMIRILIP
jgi:hypothetical protein